MKASMFFVMLSIYIVLCSYLFIRGWQALPKITAVKSVYTVLFVFLAFGYILGAIFRKSLPLWLYDTIEIACSTWFIFFLYALIAVILIDLLRVANHFLHFFPAWLTADYAKTKLITLCSVLVLIGGLFSWGYYRFMHPKVNRLELSIDKQMPDKKELKAVMVSDLHLGSVLGKKQLQRFVRLINEQQPDIILMVGDVFNSDLRPVVAGNLYEDLRQLKAPLGVYAVFGNHEYIGGDISGAAAYLKQSGICLLRDSVVNVDDSFYLVGRDDRSNRSRHTLSQLTDTLNKERAIVLMDHQPYHLEEAEECGVDVMLCGHTHDGQVWPFSAIVKGMYELSAGYKQKGSSHIYVSSGLGIWGPPFRIGTNSDMLVLSLKMKE